MSIETETGHYDQKALERLSNDELIEVRDWATDELNEHLETHETIDGGSERCAYLERLAGACEDMLEDRIDPPGFSGMTMAELEAARYGLDDPRDVEILRRSRGPRRRR